MKKLYVISIIILLFNSLLIGQTKIYAPELRDPLNKSVNQNPDVLLNWDAVTGQTTNITYEVQLATQPDFSDAITFPRKDVTALRMSELLFGHQYYWHVKAYDDEEPSDWSETWSFTILNSVNITDPKINATVYTTTSVEWVPITGLMSYQLQIDTSFSWQFQEGVTGADINGSFVVDKNNIWLVGKAGLILHYNGTDWSMMDAGITEDLNSVCFIDEMNGYAVGTGGTILNYNSDSAKWLTVDVGIGDDLTGISFSDSNNGWIVGSNGALVRFNNGSWTIETPTDINNAAGVYALAANSIWICGDGKMVAHWDGTEWSSEVVGLRDHTSIWFTDENNGWTVSKGGKIYYYNGENWVDQSVQGVGKDLYSVCFSGSNGYIVGKDGVMLNYVGIWQEMSSETTQTIQTVYVNGNAGIAAGVSGGIIMKSMEGFNSSYLHTYNVNSDTSVFEVENLLFGKKIYYRMRAMHSLDTTEWTAGRSMITQAAPDLLKPSNNSTNTDLKLIYSWDEYEGALEYNFQISPYEDFSDGYIASSDSTSAEYAAKFFGHDYFWHVNAAHGEDVSDWSETRKLTTINTVNLTKPTAGEIDVPFCPSYEWEAIVGVPTYEIWIDKNADFSQPTKGISNNSSFQCNNPLERKVMYYWKVRAITAADTSQWSEVRSFTVEGYAGIDDIFSSDYIDIYPNPASDNVTLTINSYVSESYGIIICDLTGKVIYNNKLDCRIGENDFSIKLPNLQKGLYFVNITKENKTVSKKLFID